MNEVHDQTVVEVLGEIKVKVVRYAWAFLCGLVVFTTSAGAAYANFQAKQVEFQTQVAGLIQDRKDLANAINELTSALREQRAHDLDQERRISRLENTVTK